MEIRELRSGEYAQALALAKQVFMQFDAPEYPEAGVAAFVSSLNDPEYRNMLRIYGALDSGKLVGMLATRSSGAHIALFFVDASRHRQGIGRKLFLAAAEDAPGDTLTVHSSPYAVEVYRRLGFQAADAERITDGIRYTPMTIQLKRSDCPCSRTRCPRRGACVLCRAHHAGKVHPVYCERSQPKN